MREAEHTYEPLPHVATQAVPIAVARYLDGADLSKKTRRCVCLRLTLRAGPTRRYSARATWSRCRRGASVSHCSTQSTTAENLARDGRFTLTLSLDGGMCELRLRARRLANSSPDVPLAFFEAEVDAARTHVAPYAKVTNGIVFSLNELTQCYRAEHRQIVALRG